MIAVFKKLINKLFLEYFIQKHILDFMIKNNFKKVLIYLTENKNLNLSICDNNK